MQLKTSNSTVCFTYRRFLVLLYRWTGQIGLVIFFLYDKFLLKFSFPEFDTTTDNETYFLYLYFVIFSCHILRYRFSVVKFILFLLYYVVSITACAIATSCCISDEPCQWEMANFDPHSSDISWPTVLKLKPKKHVQGTTQHAKYGADRNKGVGGADTQFATVFGSTLCFYRALHFSAYARSWDRMSSVCPSVRPSVTLVDCDHIGWKSWKLITRTTSPTPSLFVAKRQST